MGVNSLPKSVTRQRRGCDLNPGPTAPESSTLTTRLPSHRTDLLLFKNALVLSKSVISNTFHVLEGNYVMLRPVRPSVCLSHATSSRR